MIILIPAYEPRARLVELVSALRQAAPETPVVVVDDGSGPQFANVFREAQQAGAQVLSSGRENRGKGYTLREGYAYIRQNYPEQVVVSADCDGQHLVADILRIGTACEEADKQSLNADTAPILVLGGRQFKGNVPFRSRFGNTMSRCLFRVITGAKVFDTQTGLRAVNGAGLDWLLTVAGNRFDYEFRALIEARSAGVTLLELPIDTVYIEQNDSSHFRPVVDSLRVYRPLLEFMAASLFGYLVDVTVFFALWWLIPALPLLAVVVVARVVSIIANFGANLYAFRGRHPVVKTSLVRYLGLALVLLVLNYLTLATLVKVGVWVVAAKLITEIALWFFSYAVQYRWVFRQTSFPQLRVDRGRKDAEKEMLLPI